MIRIQRAIVGLVESACPDAVAVWAPSEYPRGESDLISLRLIAGPSDTSVMHYRATVDMPQSITVTLAAGPGRAYLAHTGAWWAYDAIAGETAEDVRDGLLALLETGEAAGADAIEIGGLLYGVRTAGLASHVVDTSAICRYSTSELISTIEVQAFSRTRHRSAALLTAIRMEQGNPATAQLLDSQGVAIVGNASPTIDLTAIAGSKWESRAAMQFSITQRVLAAWPISTIEEVNVDTERL